MAQPTFELQSLDVTEDIKNSRATPDGEDETGTPGQIQPPLSYEFPQQSPPRTTVPVPAVIRDTSPQPTVPDVVTHPGRFHVDRPGTVMYDVELGLADDDKWRRKARWERRGGRNIPLAGWYMLYPVHLELIGDVFPHELDIGNEKDGRGVG
ncbi:hypothetical protein K440DRAFT_641444 [Wilcoxina mikolae CBS 423.85]|nr:hypothetical protein K440DRAFT_641444 [Wilcoxina mikolae CBS 423.85]